MRPNPSIDLKTAFFAMFRCGLNFTTVALLGTVAMVLFTSCASTPKKKTSAQVVVPPQKLPKPAPMRVAQDANTRRKPPLLPKTIVNISDKNDFPSTAASTPDSNNGPQVVDSTSPKFINNEQTQDFFQGAGDGPAGENVLGSFFDTVFRPANAPNQPVSSTSYKVQ